MNKIKYLFVIAFLGILGFVAPAHAFEDVCYDLEGTLDPAQKTLTAHQTLSFKNTSGQALSEIFLRVYPNHRYTLQEKRRIYRYASYFRAALYPDGFDPGGFQMRDIRLTGAAASLGYAFEGEDQTVMKVVLPEPLADGQTLSLEISFSVRIPHRLGRFGWHRNTFALNRWYPLLAYFDEKGWHKNPDYLLHMPYVSDAADYQLRLDVPPEFVVAAGCDDVRQVIEGPRRRVTMKSTAPMRELSLAISRDYEVYEIEQDGVAIRSYYFPKDQASGRAAASHAASLMRYYREKIGPYPYKQFSIAAVYLGYGGSQNAGLIFVDARAYRVPPFLKRTFDFLVAHETGHQWWYNVVGNDEYKELWLDEGINSYWISQYLEEKYGPSAKIIDMPGWMEAFIPNPTFETTRTYRYWYFSKKGLRRPVLTDMASFYEPSMIFSVAYGKGSAVVDMLAHRMGPEAFDRFTKKYYQMYSFKVASVEDLMRLAQEESGQDLEGFFRDWLYSAKACDYGLERRGADLILKKHGDLAMPVRTRVTYEDGTVASFSSDGIKDEDVLPLAADKKLARAAADPDRLMLDSDRVNNHYPRLLDKKPVPLYHGLYDIPLFANDSAYTWLAGPSISGDGIGARSSLQRPGDWITYAATHYDANIDALKSSTGFQINNIAGRFMSAGAEFFDRQAWGDEEDDLQSYKVFLRQEMGMPYSFLEPASHVTLYLLHNRSAGRSGYLGGKEEAIGRRYRQKRETIVGTTYYSSNAGPLPDPATGYRFSGTGEIGGHMLGGADAFLRASLEYNRYRELVAGHKLAGRLKYGGGYPDDKYLFYLGSDDELRGYDYKTVQGSSCLLGSLEYRFPLARDINLGVPYDPAIFDEVQGVLFFDAGSAWYDDFDEPGWRKDVGFGLRFYFNIAGSVERVALRLDIAYPLDGDDRDTHVWVSVNHPF